MHKNSFISSFNKSATNYTKTLALTFYTTLFLSAIFFYIAPQYFYWRPWEFFDDIVYKVPGCTLSWDGYEKGGESRQYLFLCQNAWKTKVSCDADGFRSVPYKSAHYPILVVGDSHVWGSGLSDSETLPWQLAEQLKMPVFNGAKRYKMLGKLICKNSPKDTKLIIELIQSSMLCKQVFRDAFQEHFVQQPYAPYNTELRRPWQQSFTPQRYFLPYKLFRQLSLSVLYRTMKELTRRMLSIPRYYDNNKTEEDLDYVVTEITKRHNEITAMGYQHVFIPIPMQNAVMYEKIAPETVWWESELIKRLQANNVPSIDLLSIFLEHKNEELYFPSDSHWNARGVRLALSTIIPYL